jgi:hypothetical protein
MNGVVPRTRRTILKEAWRLRTCRMSHAPKLKGHAPTCGPFWRCENQGKLRHYSVHLLWSGEAVARGDPHNRGSRPRTRRLSGDGPRREQCAVSIDLPHIPRDAQASPPLPKMSHSISKVLLPASKFAPASPQNGANSPHLPARHTNSLPHHGVSHRSPVSADAPRAARCAEGGQYPQDHSET